MSKNAKIAFLTFRLCDFLGGKPPNEFRSNPNIDTYAPVLCRAEFKNWQLVVAFGLQLVPRFGTPRFWEIFGKIPKIWGYPPACLVRNPTRAIRGGTVCAESRTPAASGFGVGPPQSFSLTPNFPKIGSTDLPPKICGGTPRPPLRSLQISSKFNGAFSR